LVKKAEATTTKDSIFVETTAAGDNITITDGKTQTKYFTLLPSQMAI
jgi:hypothetical protein